MPKKKETRTFDPPSSKLQKYQNICRYINQCDIHKCWPTKENGNEEKKIDVDEIPKQIYRNQI